MIAKQRTTGILLASLIFVVLISGCSQPSNNQPSTNQQPSAAPISGSPQTFSVYESQGAGIKLKYPSDWIKKENVGGVTVAFLASKTGNSDKFQENVNIIIQKSENITLKDYVDQTVKQLSTTSDAFLIESKETALNSNPAHKFVYKIDGPSLSIQALQIISIKNNNIYMFTYTAENAIYPDYLDKVNEMISSFEFIG